MIVAVNVTYNERSALFLVCMRQEHHRLEDLDAAVDINEDGIRVVLTTRMAMYQRGLGCEIQGALTPWRAPRGSQHFES